MENKIKTGFLVLFLGILLLPILQGSMPFIKSAPLNGEFTLAPHVDFTWKKWFTGTYSDSATRYANDNVSLRPDLIRLNDEIDFDLFKKIHSEWRLLGDNSCIFQDVYIYSYLGRDFNGYGYIHEKVRKMKAIQDTLQKLGKSFVFVLAPCKAFYYPEFFPADLKNAPRGVTNYEAYRKIGDSLGLNEVDLNGWFLSMKHSSKELLFPKQGFHWSEYGALLGADSFAKYMEKIRGIEMIHPEWTAIEHTTKARYNDNDIARSMNLISPLAKETFSYPEVRYVGDKSAVRPNVIFVGDSFLFQWINEGVMDNTWNNWQIWYYNSSLINKDFSLNMQHPLDGYDRMGQIKKADCIVIMVTSRNLDKLAKTFIEDTYNYFYPGK